MNWGGGRMIPSRLYDDEAAARRPRQARGERPSLLDKAPGPPDFSPMTTSIQIDARWDDDAHVWIATSADAPGLVVEAQSWRAMIDEVRAVLPDLLELASMR